MGRAAGVAAFAALLVASAPGQAQQPMNFTQVFAFGTGVGAVPLNGNLLYRNQQLFGATYAGGSLNDGPNGIAGTLSDLGEVYQFIPSGPFIGTLYGFSGPDGAHPNGDLAADAQGNLYGTTQAGGANNLGTVFKLSPPSSSRAWTLTTLLSFSGTDGANPMAGVTFGPNGMLYGTTSTAGSGPFPHGGSAYTVSPSGTRFKELPLPQGCVGSQGNVVVDPQGNVLGTTPFGPEPSDASGCLFKIAPNGTATIVTQYGEAPQFGGVGIGQPMGNIVRDATGDVFGMATFAERNSTPGVLGIAVYEVTAITHKLVVLGVLDGVRSQSGIVRDAAGNSYGTTTNGGAIGAGSVFAVSPNGTVTTLASLAVTNLAPVAGVIVDPTGTLWGTTSAGGGFLCTTASLVPPIGCGTIFSLTR